MCRRNNFGEQVMLGAADLVCIAFVGALTFGAMLVVWLGWSVVIDQLFGIERGTPLYAVYLLPPVAWAVWLVYFINNYEEH
jgi:hypothetical protein